MLIINACHILCVLFQIVIIARVLVFASSVTQAIALWEEFVIHAMLLIAKLAMPIIIAANVLPPSAHSKAFVFTAPYPAVYFAQLRNSVLIASRGMYSKITLALRMYAVFPIAHTASMITIAELV